MQATRTKKTKKKRILQIEDCTESSDSLLSTTEHSDYNTASLISTGDIIISEPRHGVRNMTKNKIHPVTAPLTYSNDLAVVDATSGEETPEPLGDGVEVLNNPASATYERDDIISTEEKILLDNFMDKNVVEEEYNKARAVEDARLAHLLQANNNRVDHLVAIRHEEQALRDNFIDKNTADAEYEDARLREETALTKLTAGKERVHVNIAAEEEGRIRQLMDSKKDDEILHIEVASPRMASPDNTGVINAAAEHETAHGELIETLWRTHDNVKRSEAHKHQVDRTVEEARLRDRYARAETFRNQDSRLLLKQHTRKNLMKVENAEKGRYQYRTAKGIMEFNISQSCNVVTQHNQFNLSLDCDMVQTDTLHTAHKDYNYVRDPGVWRVERDLDFTNHTNYVRDFTSFSDATGENVWSINKDATIVNFAKKHIIHNSGSMDAANCKFFIPVNYHHENIRSHALSLDMSCINKVSGCYICPEGKRVQRVNTFNISMPHNTEFKNHCKHFASSDSNFINSSKGLSVYSEGELVQQGLKWDLCVEGVIAQQGKGYSLSDGGAQDKQIRNYFIPPGGDQDENKAVYVIPEGELTDRKKYFLPGAVHGEMHKHNQHKQPDTTNFKPWKPNKYRICSDSSFVNSTKFDSLNFDCDYEAENNVFEINPIEIDDEYLNESDIEDD